MKPITVAMPEKPKKKCRDGQHFENLLIYGVCTSCSRVWGLDGIKNNEPAIKRYEKLQRDNV